MDPVKALDNIVDWVMHPEPGAQRFTERERFLINTLRNKIRPQLLLLFQYRVPSTEMLGSEPEVSQVYVVPLVKTNAGPESPTKLSFELPPEKGPKATRAVWVDAAEKLGIPVEDEMGRGAIMAAVKTELGIVE